MCFLGAFFRDKKRSLRNRLWGRFRRPGEFSPPYNYLFLLKSLFFERIIELFAGGCFIVADTMYDIRFFPPRGQSSRKAIVRLSTNQEAHYSLWITQANHNAVKIVLKGENCARRVRKTRS